MPLSSVHCSKGKKSENSQTVMYYIATEICPYLLFTEARGTWNQGGKKSNKMIFLCFIENTPEQAGSCVYKM